MPEHGFDLSHRDYRQDPAKDQEAGEEQPEAAEQRADLYDRRPVGRPVRRQKIAVQRSYDNDETLEHMPTLISRLSTNTTPTRRRTPRNQSNCGTSTLQLTMVQ